jgi:hypothetical protein
MAVSPELQDLAKERLAGMYEEVAEPYHVAERKEG